jgi:CheY-like chemotaxis protein
MEKELHRIKILLVDDDQILRDMYSERLRAEGFHVEIAHDGVECLEKLEEFIPDIILLDIMMPKMNGFTVFKHLKETPEYHEIPVVFLTALIKDDKKMKEIRLDVGEEQDYVVKSETMPGELVQKVKKILKVLG